MGADLAMGFTLAMTPWDDAAAQLLVADKRLPEVVFPPPVFSREEQQALEQQLTATEWAQPALAITSVAQLKLMQALQLYPDCVGGHSFGELTALHAAGVFDEQQLLLIARRRGELMKADSAKPGAMVSVLHPAEAVLSLLAKWQLPITLANVNSPKQLVLSGSEEAITEVSQRLKSADIQYRLLSVATAFHSPQVADACQPFAEFLGTHAFQTPKTPVFSNPPPNLILRIARKLNHI